MEKERVEGRGGGVMVVKPGVNVTKVEYGQGKEEIVSVKVKKKDKDDIKVLAVSFPPGTNKWPYTNIGR